MTFVRFFVEKLLRRQTANCGDLASAASYGDGAPPFGDHIYRTAAR
jgi:hypothetical protein